MLNEIEEENLKRRKLVRSLKVANLAPEWSRSVIYTSQPYSPVKNYHRRKERMEAERRLHNYEMCYRKSADALRKASEERLNVQPGENIESPFPIMQHPP